MTSQPANRFEPEPGFLRLRVITAAMGNLGMGLDVLCRCLDGENQVTLRRGPGRSLLPFLA